MTLTRGRKKSLAEKNSETTGEKRSQYLFYRAKKRHKVSSSYKNKHWRHSLFGVDIPCSLWCGVKIPELTVNEPSQAPETLVAFWVLTLV